MESAKLAIVKTIVSALSHCDVKSDLALSVMVCHFEALSFWFVPSARMKMNYCKFLFRFVYTTGNTPVCGFVYTTSNTPVCYCLFYYVFYSDFVVILKRTLLILVTGSRINNYRIFAMKIPASKELRQRLRCHVDDPLTTIIEGFIEILKLSHQNF